MVNDELISVIIPFFNAEKFVGACIESLLNQTYKNVEIICVNDGSTDSSGEVCEAYKNQYSNIIVLHQENGGVCKARNAGLDIAKGEYCCFVDADDIVPRDALAHLHSKIKEHSADMVVGNACVELNETDKGFFFSIGTDKISQGKKAIIENAANSAFYSAWGKLYSRKLLEDTRFVEGRKINEDGFFVFQCLFHCQKVIQINDVVYNYLYHADSASHSKFSDKYYDILYFRDEKVKALEAHFPEMKALANAVYLKHSVSFLNQLLKKEKAERKDEVKRTIKEIRSHIIPLAYTTRKEKIKLFLIKNCFPLYVRIMKRGS